MNLTLSSCDELRELEFEISPLPLRRWELSFISSITSTDIKKIIINRSTELNHPVGGIVWTRLDSILTEFVERLENGVSLEVEFRGSWDVGRSEFDQKKTHLPNFVKKGRMTVLDCENRLAYCSDKPGPVR